MEKWALHQSHYTLTLEWKLDDEDGCMLWTILILTAGRKKQPLVLAVP
jgi:hypothetical protein